MTAIRETIWAAIDAALGGVSGVVEYERCPSGDPTSFPSIGAHDSGQAVVEAEAGRTRYRMDVGVEMFVQTDGGAAAHGVLNNLYSAVVTALVALVDTVPEIEEVEEGDLRVAVAPLADRRRLAASCDFAVYFSTRRGDPGTI